MALNQMTIPELLRTLATVRTHGEIYASDAEKRVIDLIEAKQTEAAKLRECVEFQKENRAMSEELGMTQLVDTADAMIERLFERIEALEGPCADWDDLVA
jgi:polyhydroxyalkanoate synthesis regulator phasin